MRCKHRLNVMLIVMVAPDCIGLLQYDYNACASVVYWVSHVRQRYEITELVLPVAERSKWYTQ